MVLISLASLIGHLISLFSFRFQACADRKMIQHHVNNRPVIGIVGVDTDSKLGESFIPVSYVSYLEQAGALVVPVRGGQPREYYEKVVNVTNGILLPGGAVRFDTSRYGIAVRHIFDIVLKTNQEGDFYPLWGTCMGFQILCYSAAGINYLKPTDSGNISWPLDFTPEAASSRLYGKLPQDIRDILQDEPVTQNQHRYSILVETFKSTNLSSFYKDLSTNKDRNGVEFVSSIEAKDYPIYGVQWHPEKNNFNWNPNYVINHSYSAIRVSQYMANFFVNEARKSSHHFPDMKAQAESVIQNSKRIYFDDGTFYQNYYIN